MAARVCVTIPAVRGCFTSPDTMGHATSSTARGHVTSPSVLITGLLPKGLIDSCLSTKRFHHYNRPKQKWWFQKLTTAGKILTVQTLYAEPSRKYFLHCRLTACFTFIWCPTLCLILSFFRLLFQLPSCLLACLALMALCVTMDRDEPVMLAASTMSMSLQVKQATSLWREALRAKKNSWETPASKAPRTGPIQ